MKRYIGVAVAGYAVWLLAGAVGAEEITLNTSAQPRLQNLAESRLREDANYARYENAWQGRNEKFMAKLKDDLARMSHLSETERTATVAFYEQQIAKDTAFRAAQHDETMKLFDALANPGLTDDQIKALIKEHRTKQSSDANKHHRQREIDIKAQQDKIGRDTLTGKGSAE